MQNIKKDRVLILGGNYGLLFAAYLNLRKIEFDIFVYEDEAFAINQFGFSVSSRDQRSFEARSPESWRAITNNVDIYSYSLVVFAMPEVAFSSSNVNALLRELLKSNTPILNLMNIPLPNFVVDRLGVKISKAEMGNSYESFSVLSLFTSPSLVNCSPEPQIYKSGKPNVINLRLGGTFRCSNLHGIVTPSLREKLLAKIDKNISLGISLIEYEDPWVSVSKWPMLITGNYRCLRQGKLIPIASAVTDDPNKSKDIYNEISSNMAILGAPRNALIPFHMYLKACSNLDAPSSVGRAIYSGSTSVERVDRLLFNIFSSQKLPVHLLSEVVDTVDRALDEVRDS